MKHFILFAFFLSTAAMCNCSKSAIPPALANTEWIAVKSIDRQTKESKPFPEEGRVYIIRFNADGTFIASGLCGFYEGKYVTGSNHAITFSAIERSNGINCAGISEWDTLIIQCLMKAQSYQVVSSKQLIIHGEESEIYFNKTPPGSAL